MTMGSHPQRGCPEDVGGDIGVGHVAHDVLPSRVCLDFDPDAETRGGQ